MTILGIIFGWKDHLFRVGRLVSHHPGAAHFRACPGGGRHGNDRRDTLGIGARPPVAYILEVPDGPALPRHERHQLAGIQPRPAAEGHDPVMPAGAEGFDPGEEVGFDRIWLHLSKERSVQPALLQDVQARLVISSRERPVSVTSRGLAMPAARQASANSAMRPAPKRTAVG
jgi:hypothetical protein